MVAGYAAFARHLGFYPHSGNVIGQIDCRPFRTSRSGVLFTPERPLPEALLRAIVESRQAELAAGRDRRRRATATPDSRAITRSRRRTSWNRDSA